MSEINTGLSGISLSQVQEAIANNPVVEEEQVVEEEVIEKAPEPEIEVTTDTVITNPEEGRCYLLVESDPEEAVVRVESCISEELIEKNQLGVYDVEIGNYSIDIAADGYESIRTLVYVSEFDIEKGYMRIHLDLNEMEPPKEETIVETDIKDESEDPYIGQDSSVEPDVEVTENPEEILENPDEIIEEQEVENQEEVLENEDNGIIETEINNEEGE